MTKYLVYMTVKSEEEATRIGTELIKQRLAACANIIGTSKSFFWWDGAVQSGSETVIILKTSEKKIDLLISTARELHSYGCPAIVAIEIKKGNPDFLEWISKEIP